MDRSFVSDEIASQPECWRRIPSVLGEARSLLPAAGERVAVIGCGTSWFMAMAYAALREGHGQGITDAWTPDQLPRDPRLRPDRGHHAIGDDDGGAGRARARPRPHPERGHHGRAGRGRERRGPNHRARVRGRAVGGPDPLRDHGPGVAAGIAGADDGAARGRRGGGARGAPGRPPGDRRRSPSWAPAGRSGWPTRRRSSCARRRRHGPRRIRRSSTATARSASRSQGATVWMFGTPPDGLAADVAATGATFVTSGALDPMAHLIVAQRLAVALAERRGVDPDQPRHLTRSVIL